MEIGIPPERSTHNHNLPASLSSFIGREQELREIHQRLREHRLVTLTGSGGTGKTRLVLEAAVGELNHFADVLDGQTAPATGPRDSLRALRLADAAEQSLKSGSPVNLEGTFGNA